MIVGDCVEVMANMEPESIDAIVTDPPYELGFMGKHWDSSGVSYQPETWQAALRVLKPGGHLLAFGGTRTYHRLACAIEDAGFEIRDTICWLYGAGFPKAWNFDTQYPANCWCECREKPLSYGHGESATKHDVRSVRSADLSTTNGAKPQCGEVLFESVSESSTSTHGQANGKSSDAWGKQSSVDGRHVHRTQQGISDGARSKPSKSKDKRVRAGAHSDSRADTRPTASARGRSASSKQGPSGQSAGEPEGVHNSSGALDDRALRDGGRCARCGKLSQVFHGFSTGLKPAHEPIVVARKPLIGTVAKNVLEHGTGAINVDGCRVGIEQVKTRVNTSITNGNYGRCDGRKLNHPESFHSGRWPANLVLDEQAAQMLDEQTGKINGRVGMTQHGSGTNSVYGSYQRSAKSFTNDGQPDSGGASRFFYCAKASKAERGEANNHPTVKPVNLVRWLVRLVTPPGGTVLDPFAGSGTTGIAAQLEGFEFIGIELDEQYANIARARIDNAEPQLTLT